MGIGPVPWVLAILTAGWFGWLASSVGRNWILWAVGGAAFGLVISTIIFGLCQAASIPFSDHERSADRLEWTVAAVLVILIAGWALTSSLHRHHIAIWRRFRPGPASSLKPASETTHAGTPVVKPSAGRSQP